MDSEGLLLLTDEPGFNHRLLDPGAAHADVSGAGRACRTPSLEHPPRGGLVIQGHRTRPARVVVPGSEPVVPPRDPPIRFRKSVPTSWIELTLVEGKNRQVRRASRSACPPSA
ncbi:MAG: hypothetical protein U1G05_18400 [Kiritimatiellia bacterium]